MENQMPTIALIEASHWHAPLYIDALAEMGVKVVGISDEDIQVAQSVADRFGCRSYQDYRQLLQVERPEFVFAFGKHVHMPEIARSVIKTGAGLAIEKPAGTTYGEVAQIHRIAQERSAFVAVPFVLRYSAMYEWIRESLENGSLGQITNFYCRFIAGPPERYLQSNSAWMLERTVSGGGCTINLAVHFIDLFLDLIAPEYTTEVFAAMSNKKYQLSIEDFSSLNVLAKEGTRATIETGYAYPSSAQSLRHMGYYLTTTKGYLTITDGNLDWRSHDGSSIRKEMVTATEPFYRIFVEDTLEAFVKGKRPKASLAELLEVMRIIDASYLSDDEHRIVGLDGNRSSL